MAQERACVPQKTLIKHNYTNILGMPNVLLDSESFFYLQIDCFDLEKFYKATYLREILQKIQQSTVKLGIKDLLGHRKIVH